MINYIYWAYHWYDFDERNIKTIGHFTTQQKAEMAIETVKDKPGFIMHPDGFSVDRIVVDSTFWTGGFGE